MPAPPSLRPLVSIVIAAALFIGCGSDSSTAPTGTVPTFLAATVDTNPSNTISAVVTLHARGFDSGSVRFWTNPAQTAQTPSFAFSGDSVLRVPVLGLDTLSTYTFEAVLKAPGETAVAVDTLSFTTGGYPAWLPRATVAGTDTSPGFLLLSYPDGPVILDNAGKIRWYKYLPGGVLGSFQAQPNGVYTWLNAADSSGYYLFDELGEPKGRLACVGYKTRFHDVLVRSGGDAWIMCDAEDTLDLRPFGGFDSAVVTSTVVQHLDPNGAALFQWKSLDHFQITDAPLADRIDKAVNFTHGNGIDIDHDGNLLLSFRTLSEVTKVDVSNGNIIWRLGGLANQFTLLNDSKGSFARQHGMRVAGPSEVQFLDNGLVAPSRLVRYLINPTALTATLEMEFIDAPTTYTIVGGSTMRYPNGHSLVSFGRAGRVVEVDPSGNRAWELGGITGTYVFRAQRIDGLYFPGFNATSR